MLQGNIVARPDIRNPFVRSVTEIDKYQRLFGWRALFQGFLPLYCRETIYVAAITAVGPFLASKLSSGSIDAQEESMTLAGALGTFSVGTLAGVISAPMQTLNVVTKDERYRGFSLRAAFTTEIWTVENNNIFKALRRLMFGSAIRSVRCGCASTLYYIYRNIFSQYS